MNRFRIWLALLATAWLAATAAAAPAPDRTPASRGPVADALRLRDKLPTTPPPVMLHARMIEDGVVGLERRGMAAVQVRRLVTSFRTEVRKVTENVRLPGGKVRPVERTVTVMVPVTQEIMQTVTRPVGKAQTTRVPVKSCKFFEVSKDGKLEALDAAKATARLKKRTAVLTGDKDKVDPHHLDLIKPGTLYLLTPPAPAPRPVPVERPRKFKD